DVHLDGRTFHFSVGEPIRVEYSHKYTDASFGHLLQQAGLEVVAHWNADHPAYGLRLLRPSP
ncbi:MAG: L-histidine N(alpha)-methyltransferase, partial [Stenotrophomonas maltophilia]